MMKRIFPVLLLTLLLAVSCTENISDPASLSGGSWEDTFNEFWTVMDDSYVHFSSDSINWDNVYGEYLDKFRSLSREKEEDSFTAFRYFKEIIYSLSDYHYRLLVSDDFGYTLDTRPSILQKWRANGNDIMDFVDISRDGSWYTVNGGSARSYFEDDRDECWKTAVDGYSETEGLANAFHTSTLYPFILSDGATFTPDDTDEDTPWNTLLESFGLKDTTWFYGVTENGVLYIHFSAFVSSSLLDFYRYILAYDSLTREEQTEYEHTFNEEKKAYDDILVESGRAGDDEYGKKLSFFLIPSEMIGLLDDAVTEGAVTVGEEEKKIEGIVLDIRCNGGGDAEFLARIMGTFFCEDKTVGTVYSRMGFSRWDYTPSSEFRLGFFNSALTEDYQGRLAVIVNGLSVSCSEISVLASKLLKNSKVFGSVTYGATCPISSPELYQSGPYRTDKLTVRTTTFRYTAYDGRSYEGYGISPDVPVALSTTHDYRYESAVRWAETGETE